MGELVAPLGHRVWYRGGSGGYVWGLYRRFAAVRSSRAGSLLWYGRTVEQSRLRYWFQTVAIDSPIEHFSQEKAFKQTRSYVSCVKLSVGNLPLPFLCSGINSNCWMFFFCILWHAVYLISVCFFLVLVEWYIYFSGTWLILMLFSWSWKFYSQCTVYDNCVVNHCLFSKVTYM